jgi:hypothetical protein
MLEPLRTMSTVSETPLSNDSIGMLSATSTRATIDQRVVARSRRDMERGVSREDSVHDDPLEERVSGLSRGELNLHNRSIVQTAL